ncbi:MAG: type II toxin-antitoxin system VapC family toxin [Egibacteraceae bacterium]
MSVYLPDELYRKAREHAYPCRPSPRRPALVDVLVDQAHAGWLLDQLASGEVMAPAHQPAEVGSAVARLHRAGALTADTARDALTAALALPQQLVVASAAQVQRAFGLRDRIRVLDGLYVALAEERGVALLTTDQRLVRADPPCEVLAPPP